MSPEFLANIWKTISQQNETWELAANVIIGYIPFLRSSSFNHAESNHTCNSQKQLPVQFYHFSSVATSYRYFKSYFKKHWFANNIKYIVNIQKNDWWNRKMAGNYWSLAVICSHEYACVFVLYLMFLCNELSSEIWVFSMLKMFEGIARFTSHRF